MAAAVTLLSLVPLASQGSGAAVGDPAVTSYAADMVLGDLVRSRPKCPDARKGLAYYRSRYRDWRAERGLETPWPVGRKPISCSDAVFLAAVWKGKARTARLAFERWQRTIGQVVARLERGLAGTPMAGTGIILEREARRHRVSPYFMVAVAATESSIGVEACSNNRRNVWGLASCVNSWPVPYFDTWSEAIGFYARFLASRWPGHSTPYSFRGYAACSECWARKVSHWMSSLFGVPAETRYP